MIELAASAALSRRTDRAIATLEHAQVQVYRLRMLDVARIVRDAFSAAEYVVVDTDRNPDTGGVQLVAILDALSRKLWSQHPPLSFSLAAAVPDLRAVDHSTEDDNSLDDTIAQLEYLLGQATDVRPPETEGTPVVRTNPVGDSHDVDEFMPTDPGEAMMFRIPLPDPEAVAAIQANQPDRAYAYLGDLADEPLLWLAAPAKHPAMTAAGVHVTAYRNADDGLLTLDIGTVDARLLVETTGAEPAIDIRLNGARLVRAEAQAVPGTASGGPEALR